MCPGPYGATRCARCCARTDASHAAQGRRITTSDLSLKSRNNRSEPTISPHANGPGDRLSCRKTFVDANVARRPMSPTPTQPVAQGTLASTPFAHLILYIYQRRSSGTLVVRLNAKSRGSTSQRTNSESAAVLFHRGRAVAARVGTPTEALDQALLPLCALRDADYEFYEEDLVGSGPNIVTGMFDPYAFVADAARQHASDDIIDQVLTRFTNTPLCVLPGMDLERLMLRSSELHFAAVLRAGTATIGTLLGSDQLPEATARRVLYALLVTKVVGPFAPNGDENRSGPPQASGVPSGLPAGKISNSPQAGSGRNSSLTPEQRRRQSS